ncbi:iron chelate uptake ABC transporter family permease subunit [Pseudodesulfovibrio cashew]|uniref:Iron chelate uptake ABC transporter family permease subunit n=1 Tax=Pseudodesulfovibrio cashew TaxID=2678688 RepID=A0A6I6JJM8_9BACT|nr:iron ABC transporter permease [Pseudodesulfovibrio cashew]QGY40512.1 iron chelate uptake ABC transporter family permease subunit [Pseudodesulfovibrio cashew]
MKRTAARILPTLRGNSPASLLAGLGIVLAACMAISMTMGNYPISYEEVGRVISHHIFSTDGVDAARQQLLSGVLFEIRAPRLIAAALIGAALSVSGAAYQAMFVNPLVSPGILGVLPGASFGAALGLLVADSTLGVQVMSFTGGVLAVGLALLLARFYDGDKVMMLILGGIISGSLFTSLLSIVKYTADPTDQLPAIVYWLMGGLSLADMNTVAATAPPVLIGIACILLMSRHLNILSLGDEEAKSLGVNVRLIRLCLIFLATVVSALTVAVGGLIGWVGLVIPHIGRMLVGPNNAILLPASALIGAIYLVVVDDVARMLLDVEIPLGIITSLVGIPFFSLVLKNTRKGWN